MATMFQDLLTQMVGTTHALKMAHWSTTSYAFHVASGELADELFEKTDTIMEALLSVVTFAPQLQYVTLQLPQKQFANGKEAALSQVRQLQIFLRGLETVEDLKHRTEILNIRDDVLASIDKFLYKLRFA